MNRLKLIEIADVGGVDERSLLDCLKYWVYTITLPLTT